MNYTVIVPGDLRLDVVGQTLFLSDARSILNNYYRGYIASKGETIETKNWSEGE